LSRHREKSFAPAAIFCGRSWLCTQERRNPEVVNIFGAATRYRRATVNSSHDDAHPDSSTLQPGKIYSFPLHISRVSLLVLRLRRGAAATTWAPRSSACEKQRRRREHLSRRTRIIQRCTRAKFALLRCTSAELFFSCCGSVAAAATNWALRLITCEKQRAAPRATAWAPRSSTRDAQRASPLARAWAPRQTTARRHGHRPGHHDQVPATHNKRRREQRPEHHD
jgi:hypothetical protein